MPLISDQSAEDPYAKQFGDEVRASAPRMTPACKHQANRNTDIATAQKRVDNLMGSLSEGLLNPEDVASFGGSGSFFLDGDDGFRAEELPSHINSKAERVKKVLTTLFRSIMYFIYFK